MNGLLKHDDSANAVADWYENTYECSECGALWTDEWSCTCNDRCPECNVETEPASSIDLSEPLTEEDYKGAARLLASLPESAASEVTAEDAKAYAEAVWEGSEERFSPPSRELIAKVESMRVATISPIQT
jgi:hypothetical protein